MTSLPSTAGAAQAVVSRRSPATSTTHMRQAPWLVSQGWWQSVGMSIPLALATSRTVIPFSPVQALPSIVSVMDSPMGYSFTTAPKLHTS